jgi:hypothetical protein
MTESKSWLIRQPSVVNALRAERGRADEGDVGAELGQAPDVAAGDAAVGDVADDEDVEAGDVAEPLADGVEIEQALRRVLVRAVAGVDDAALEAARQHLGGAGGGVADDEDVDAHRLDRAGGVDEGFALAGGAAFFAEIDDVGAKPRSGQGEAEAGAGAVFEEGVDDDAAAQGGALF